MNLKAHITLICSGFLSLAAMAQDPQFSQFYAAPQYLNPALTGNTHQDRIALNYRLQWPGVQPGFETYMFAYDHRFAEANSGVGGYVMHDKAGSGGLYFTQVAFSYSYEARISNRKAWRMGLRLGYTDRGTNPNGFLFADQIIRDNAPSTIEQGIMERISYLDMAVGGLYYTDVFWVGASLNHLNRPNQSLYLEGDARLPMRTSIHAGYRVPLDERPINRSETVFTLATHYKAQGKWDQLDFGGYVEHKRASAGMWYRGIPMLKAYQRGYSNNEAVILMAGFETEQQLKFVYSFDITISKMTMRSGGAHELSIIYEWPRKSKSRKYKIVPCPKF